MDRTKDRPLKQPAVQDAAVRNTQVLIRQRQIQRMMNVITVCAVLAVGYFSADVGLVVLGLTVFTGILGGLSIKRVRAFGEQYRLMKVVEDSLDADQANAWRIAVKSESRYVLAILIITAVFLAGIVVWVATGEGRMWVVLLCIVFLAYALSSVKTLATDPNLFMQLTSAHQEDSCRIVLFRSFDARSSSLARSALAPILAGYGSVDIVLDETFDQAESEGVFGGQVVDVGGLVKVHRFANAEWKDRVGEMIGDSDIAIVDMTTVSPGVVWELAQCYKHLPPFRVYGVINAGALESSSLKDYMAAFYDELSSHPEMPTNVRPYTFIFAPSAGQQEALANDIHRKMFEIIAVEAGVQDTDQFYGGS